MCETKNNVWKKCEISIQDSIDSYIETTKIKPNFASLNNGLKCRKPVFMWVSGICFIDWSQFGSICGESNSRVKENLYGKFDKNDIKIKFVFNIQ